MDDLKKIQSEEKEALENEAKKAAEETQQDVKSIEESLEKDAEEAVEALDDEEKEEGKAVIYEIKESKKGKKKPKKSLSSYFKSTRFKKGSFATILTIGFIVIVVLFNVFFSILEDRFPSLRLDMTENKIYTLSDDALEAAEKIDLDTTIYVLANEETAKNDSILSAYGLQYSQVPVLCEKCAEANSKIHVEYIDLDLNPTFASQTKYQNYKLSTGTVIIENARRIRVLGIGDFFSTQYDSNYNATYYMHAGSAITTALMQVQAAEIPVIAVAAGGHSELLANYLDALQELMESNNFEVKSFDILTEEIPEDTSILLLPTPMTDYTQTELEKMDAFLSEAKVKNLSIWVTCDPTQPSLPNFSAFLSEWGIELEENSVIVETDPSHMTTNYGTYFISELTGDVEIGGIKGTSDYGYFFTPVCRPINLLYSYNSNNSTFTVAKSSSQSYVQSLSEEDTEETEHMYGESVTVALSQKIVKIGDTNYAKNVVVFGSSGMFVSSYLSSSTFGNAEYLVDLARYSAGISDSGIGVYQDKTEVNTYDISITSGARNFFGIGVFTILIPLSLIVAGLWVFLKRRHL